MSNVAGKQGEVDAAVFDTDEIQDAAMEAYLQERQRQNTNANRKHYSLFGGYNCGTLICEALDAAGRHSPQTRSLQTPGQMFNNFMMWPGQYGVTQLFIFLPAQEKVSSKICFEGENGKNVCK